VRALGELTAETDPQTSRTPKRAVCLVTLSVATEAQVKGHMCWSSAFDPFEGSTLSSSRSQAAEQIEAGNRAGLEP